MLSSLTGQRRTRCVTKTLAAGPGSTLVARAWALLWGCRLWKEGTLQRYFPGLAKTLSNVAHCMPSSPSFLSTS
jgi:hypothetical protein